jgi:hypothetical protein
MNGFFSYYIIVIAIDWTFTVIQRGRFSDSTSISCYFSSPFNGNV